MTRALALGILIGLPIAAAPGPMFFLVLRRTLANGWRSGLVSGLGIATGDGIYATVAAFSITALINILVAQRRWIGLIGGIAIILIGAASLRPSALPKGHATYGPSGRDPAGQGSMAYVSTLGLTLANPPTILAFLAVFAGLGVHVASGWLQAAALVIGVTLGSACWWLVVTGGVAYLRGRISPRVTRGIRTVSGLALIGFGGLITLQAL